MKGDVVDGQVVLTMEYDEALAVSAGLANMVSNLNTAIHKIEEKTGRSLFVEQIRQDLANMDRAHEVLQTVIQAECFGEKRAEQAVKTIEALAGLTAEYIMSHGHAPLWEE